VLPVGYSDGYLRSLSNRGQVLVGGRRAPVRGRVCMNLTVVELGPGSGAAVGDEAVLLGGQGADEIPIDELAGLAGTIPYELCCSLGAANRRVHLPAA
jgi:alanine racemase